MELTRPDHDCSQLGWANPDVGSGPTVSHAPYNPQPARRR
eukprot:COSAG04_NODE_3614_length_2670_cov_1.665111_3_plen_39_part_01